MGKNKSSICSTMLKIRRVIEMEEKPDIQKLIDRLNGELKLWDEVSEKFRDWNREWNRFGLDGGKIPISIIELMEELNSEYNLSKK